MALITYARRLALFLVAFSLPLEGIQIFNAAGRATPFKLTTAFLLLVVAAEFTLGQRRPPRDKKALWVLAFAVTFGISFLHSVLAGFPVANLITISTTFYSLVVFYFLLTYAITSRTDMLVLLWALVFGAAVTGLPAALGLQETANRDGRLTGLAGQENLLGLNMMMTLPLVFALFITARSMFVRSLLVGAGVLVAGGMLASLSRTAFVSTAGIWGLWAYRFRRLDTIKYVIPAVLAGVAAVLLAPESVSDRIDTMLDPSKRAADGPIQERLAQYEVSLWAVASNPVLGIGLRRFVVWHAEQDGLPEIHNLVHNAYLRVAVEQGLLGLACYLGVLLMAWRQYTATWRAARARRSLRDRELSELGHYATFLQFSLFGSMIAGLFTHNQDSKIVWIFFVLSTVVLRLARERVEVIAHAGPVEESAETGWANGEFGVAATGRVSAYR